MAKLRVFVSSTYVDLKDLRQILWDFITNAGYEAVLFEKGGIYYDHTKPLVESCCDTIHECDIFVLVVGGRYGSPAAPRRKRAIEKFNSFTKQEFLAARGRNIPTYTFVASNVLSEYQTYQNNRSRKLKYAHVDDAQVFELLDSIVTEGKHNLLLPYAEAMDITAHLKEQWAEMLKRHLVNEKVGDSKVTKVYVNAYKLCYFRKTRKLSFADLSHQAGIDLRILRRLEKVHVGHELSTDCFSRCEESVLRKLEHALGCEGKLEAGKADDFLTQYMQFYRTYKAPKMSQRSYSSQHELAFRTRAIAFDFDGTLTSRDSERTTWERIWELLHYSINECADLHRRYQNKEFSHQGWCDQTLEKFKAANFRLTQLQEIATSTQLINGTRETIERLRSEGVKLYIISGSIKYVICHALGDMRNCFDEISANDIVFDRNGVIRKIIGTHYDFRGKADFLKRIIKDNGLSSLDVLFVGNSCNDVFASESGVRTLCVNPRFTDPDDLSHWTYAIRKMDNLEDIMRYVTI